MDQPPPRTPMPSLHGARMMALEADARAAIKANPDNPRTGWWNILRRMLKSQRD